MLTDYTDESEVSQYLPKSVTTPSGRFLPLFDDDGKIIAANLPSVVPGDYIKVCDYQGDREIFACLDVPMRVGTYEIKQPSLGVWSMLETFASPFVTAFGVGLDYIHCFRALYINHHRESCAKDVYTWVYQEKPDFDIEDAETWTDFDHEVLDFAMSLVKRGFDIADNEVWWNIRQFFDLSFNGHAMIPPGGGGSRFWFGAETMGSIIAGLGPAFNMPPSQVFWDMPLIIVGHAMAALTKQNGVKGVARPKDPQDVRKQLILAAAREYKGELHPWQINEPLKRQLTKIQMGHNKLVAEFKELQSKARARLGVKKNG